MAAETLVLLGLSGFLLYQLLVDSLDSNASAVSLVHITLAPTAWIALTAMVLVRRKSFARESAVVWQALLGAIGLASERGLFDRPEIGSGLLVPALAVLALLLFWPAVSKNLGTTRDAD